MTKVINLFGGSGIGKSTTAAGLFYEMKLRGYHVELVREYVKGWAWEGRKVGEWDQSYLFGKQSKAESGLYGKIDYIVTDSPLLLSPIYEGFYGDGEPIIAGAVLNFLNKTAKKGIERHNFVLDRQKPFDPRGRYETAETAEKVDEYVKKMLNTWEIPYRVVIAPDRERVTTILDSLHL